MFDCNLIKSRAQKIQESQMSDLQSMYHKMQMPEIPSMPSQTPVKPIPTTPAPQTPAAPSLPSAPPEPEVSFPLNPLLPRILPPSGTIKVPPNPLLPPAFAESLDYESLQYLNGYLRTKIGSYIEVEFLIGTTNRLTYSGILKGVGLNYIVLKDPTTDTDLACDFYTIKFVKVLTSFDKAVEAMKQSNQNNQDHFVLGKQEATKTELQNQDDK